MNEKILSNKKNGMGMLLLFCLLYLIAIAGCVLSAIALEHEFNALPVIAGLVVSIIWLCIGWIPFLGLKVLKPQEALVLTLFGNYIGTLKEAGFYFVNPFCTSVNPASKTKLSQSGDVDSNSKKGANLSSLLGVSTTGTSEESSSKKISLKVMTLNNSRQKINDCLGNPIEIGIAVTWRVVELSSMLIITKNISHFSVMVLFVILSASIHTTLLLMSILPVTERLMREVSVAPVRLLHSGSAKRFR